MAGSSVVRRIDRRHTETDREENIMGRGILLWLLGVPLPIILLLALCTHN
jgi:hypothetical protein